LKNKIQKRITLFSKVIVFGNIKAFCFKPVHPVNPVRRLVLNETA
jgi:hypothetical protein